MKLNKTCSPLSGSAVTQWSDRRVQSPAQEVSVWGRPAVRAEARMSLSGWAYLNQTLEDEHFLPVVFPHPSAEMPSRGIHASYIPWNPSRVKHHLLHEDLSDRPRLCLISPVSWFSWHFGWIAHRSLCLFVHLPCSLNWIICTSLCRLIPVPCVYQTINVMLNWVVNK